eukprot:767321-Hanusia_phi.AAC.1
MHPSRAAVVAAPLAISNGPEQAQGVSINFGRPSDDQSTAAELESFRNSPIVPELTAPDLDQKKKQLGRAGVRGLGRLDPGRSDLRDSRCRALFTQHKRLAAGHGWSKEAGGGSGRGEEGERRGKTSDRRHENARERIHLAAMWGDIHGYLFLPDLEQPADLLRLSQVESCLILMVWVAQCSSYNSPSSCTCSSVGCALRLQRPLLCFYADRSLGAKSKSE